MSPEAEKPPISGMTIGGLVAALQKYPETTPVIVCTTGPKWRRIETVFGPWEEGPNELYQAAVIGLGETVEGQWHD